MIKTIVANIMAEESRMALLEDGQLAEVSVERSESGQLVGNIYKGKVKNILPGMQAAFVDIGRDKNAFLYLGDSAAGNKGGRVLTPTAGQDILVQIAKDPIGGKGPRATANISLPGRFVVLMPTVEYIGVSRRIDGEGERERLRKVAERIKPFGMGIIVRTVAAGKSEEELQRDVDYLHNLWNSLSARYKRTTAPALIYRDVDLIIRIVRDYLTPDVAEFVVDSRDGYNRVLDLLKHTAPEMVNRVKLYEGTDDIFSHYNLTSEIEKVSKRVVPLKCGGYIVIDHTEALTVIDVNTGKFVGCTSLSDTVYRTNMEAAAEIARQIRLRDIGGIIIIDFIDMDKGEQRKAVLDQLAEKVRQDRTKTHILGLTGLGLVEMTRKKARKNIDNLLYNECPCCEGRGRIQSPATVGINVRRKLRHLVKNMCVTGHLIVQVHPKVAEELQEEKERLEQELARSITVESIPSMHAENFSILQGRS